MDNKCDLVQIYDWRNVVVQIDGHTATGFADGDDAVSVNNSTDTAELIKGLGGVGMFSVSSDKSAEIVLKFLPNSPTHKLLRKISAQVDSGHAKTFSVTVSDANSGEGGSAQCCMITKRPDIKYGGKATERAWTIVANEWIENDYNFA